MDRSPKVLFEEFVEMHKSAILSEDRRYRYTLIRTWDKSLPRVMFIGLNPSTADETTDDLTIKKCIGFAKRWGFGSIVMVNLFAIRATDPRVAASADEPIGEENDRYILSESKGCEKIVAAWGDQKWLGGRDKTVMRLLGKMYCLGQTRNGHPKHPSRLGYSTALCELIVEGM